MLNIRNNLYKEEEFEFQNRIIKAAESGRTKTTSQRKQRRQKNYS